MRTDCMISVIVPVYNAQGTIENCINSILSQSIQNFELIIIDDGSVDETGKIVASIAKNNEKIRVFYQDNSGSSAARNLGISVAKGQYIVFVDSDDYIEHSYLEEMLNAALQYNADAVICGIRYWYKDEDYSAENGFDNNSFSADIRGIGEIIFQSCCNGMIYSPCNKFYNASIIKDNKIYFANNKEPIEDILFNCEYFECIHSAATLSKNLYVYVKSGAQSNVTKFRDNIWVSSSERSNAMRTLLEHWNLNSEIHLKWLASEYVGGKSDCVSNCYRAGSNIKYNEKCALFDQYLFKDVKFYDSVNLLKGIKLHYDKKILCVMSNVKIPFAFVGIYNLLFFIRYKCQSLYFRFRKVCIKTK